MNTTTQMSGNDAASCIWFLVGTLGLLLAAMAIDYTLAAMRGEIEKD